MSGLTCIYKHRHKEECDTIVNQRLPVTGHRGIKFSKHLGKENRNCLFAYWVSPNPCKSNLVP